MTRYKEELKQFFVLLQVLALASTFDCAPLDGKLSIQSRNTEEASSGWPWGWIIFFVIVIILCCGTVRICLKDTAKATLNKLNSFVNSKSVSDAADATSAAAKSTASGASSAIGKTHDALPSLDKVKDMTGTTLSSIGSGVSSAATAVVHGVQTLASKAITAVKDAANSEISNSAKKGAASAAENVGKALKDGANSVAGAASGAVEGAKK